MGEEGSQGEVIPESSVMDLSDLYLVNRFLTGIYDNAFDFPAT